MIDNEPKQIEPLLGVRQGLFGLQGAEEEGERFALTLLSPIRVFSNAPVSLAKRGKEYVLQTKVSEVKQVVVMLASEYPLLASRLTNIAYLKVASALGFTELRFLPDGAGVCEFKLTLPSYGQAPPAAAPVPDYSEKAR